MNPLVVSLVVATRGRATPFRALFESLDAQDFRAFEVIVVDQNEDDRAGAPAIDGWSFPIKHLKTPAQRGLSRARNIGAREARGALVMFPDDDCWYPAHGLAQAVARIDDLGADILAGRAADATGRDINGRFETGVTRIDRANVFTTGIEWMVIFRRDVLDTLGGYDPEIGVGASTPWQACEGQDIMLRALAKGYRCWFDPALIGHHAELDVSHPSMIAKGRGYARGLGYVLRLHGYRRRDAARWILRPCLRAALSLMRGRPSLFAYYASVARGRWDGWRANVAADGRSVAPTATATPEAAMPTRP